MSVSVRSAAVCANCQRGCGDSRQHGQLAQRSGQQRALVRGVASLERRLLLKCVGFVKGRAAVVLATPAKGHILRSKVVLGFGTGQLQPFQGPARFRQTAVAGV